MPNAQDYITLDPLAADPTTPPEGALWWNTTTEQLMIQTGTGAKVLAQAGAAGGGGLVQSVAAQLDADASTSSASYVTLLTAAITTTGGALIINATLSGILSVATRLGYIQVTVDGTIVAGAGAPDGAASNTPLNLALVRKVTGLAAGAHTVLLQWKSNSGGFSCRPVAQPGTEHATLLVEEVSV